MDDALCRARLRKLTVAFPLLKIKIKNKTGAGRTAIAAVTSRAAFNVVLL